MTSLKFSLLFFVGVLLAAVSGQSPFTAFLVVDGSESISLENFNVIKDAMKSYVTSRLSESNLNKLGIVLYGNDIVKQVEASSDRDYLQAQIDSLQYPDEGTATYKGIKRGKELLQQDISGNAKVMIVITDGISGQPQLTEAEANSSRDSNITMYAVGITEFLSDFGISMVEMFEAELVAIAGSRDRVLSVEEFSGLSRSLDTVLSSDIQELDSNPSVVIGSTIVLQVTVDQDYEQGIWYNPLGQVTDTTRYSVVGRSHRLTITNAQNSDAGTYYYLINGGSIYFFGRLSVTDGAERYSNWGQWTFDTSCSVTCGKGSETQIRRRSCLSGSCSGNLEERKQNPCERSQCPAAPEGVPVDLVPGVTVLRGQSVILAVTVPTLTSVGKWYSPRGEILTAGRFRKWSDANSHRLTITNIELSDEGTYFYLVDTYNFQGNLTVVESTTGPTYGQWLDWQESSSCSQTCGNGVLTEVRSRSCLSGTCSQSDLSETRQMNCNRQNCGATYGQWLDWQETSSCSQTCGNGVLSEVRYRSCLSGTCSQSDLSETRQMSCNLRTCVGGWGDWSLWVNGTCSVTCGGGVLTQTRTRSCRSGTCSGESSQTQQVVCGQGSCTSGTPQNLTSGVRAVKGQTVIIQVPMRVGSAQGNWYGPRGTIVDGGRYTIAVVGGSNHLTIRNVDEGDAGTYYYVPIAGTHSQGTLTVDDSGPTYGQWSGWRVNSTCTRTCGNGVRTEERSRSCLSGTCSQADLRETRQTSCNLGSCGATYGQWLDWQETSSCSQTCGNGVLTEVRYRSCLSGTCSQADLSETRQMNCNRQNCGATYGQWLDWQQASSCSQTCGNGVLTEVRYRSCLSGTCSQSDLSETRQTSCNLQTCGSTYGQWGNWEDISSCSVTCGNGEKNQRRSRSCLSGSCSVLQESQTSRCFEQSCPGDNNKLCESAEQNNGIGYRYHPTDCNKYIQCYPAGDGTTFVMFRTCPIGKFWNQDLFKCENSYGVNCPIDKCKDDCRASYKVAGSCGAYVQCYEDKSEFQCCPRSYMYVPGKGCRFNLQCDEFCNNPWVNNNHCMRRPVDNAPNRFRMFAGDLGWQASTCPGNSVFDLLSCECKTKESDCNPSYSVTFRTQPSLITRNIQFGNSMATFQRNSRLMLNVTAQERSYPVGMKFRYRETAVNSEWRVLVSSDNCNRRVNLKIALDEDNELQIHLTTWYGDVNILTLSTQGMDDWKTVTLGYDGFSLRAHVQSGDQVVMGELVGQRSGGMTGILECGLSLGAGDDSGDDDGFIGDVNMLSLYNCDPTMP